MDKHSIELKYKQAEQVKSELQSFVNLYLENKDNSLNDRWEVWTKYSQKNHESYIHSYPEFLYSFEEYIHEDFFQKYQTVTYENILDIYNNYLTDNDKIFIRVRLQDMKEYIMKENLGSYKFDW